MEIAAKPDQPFSRVSVEDDNIVLLENLALAAQRDEESSVLFQSDIDRVLQLSLSIEDLSADKKEEGNQSNNKVADALPSNGKRKSQQMFTAQKDNEIEQQDADSSISVDVRPPCLAYRNLKEEPPPSRNWQLRVIRIRKSIPNPWKSEQNSSNLLHH